MPVLVMRDTTERPEGTEAGTLRLVGTDEENIYNTFTKLLENEELYKKIMYIVYERFHYLPVDSVTLDFQEVKAQ